MLQDTFAPQLVTTAHTQLIHNVNPWTILRLICVFFQDVLSITADQAFLKISVLIW